MRIEEVNDGKEHQVKGAMSDSIVMHQDLFFTGGRNSWGCRLKGRRGGWGVCVSVCGGGGVQTQ